MINVGNIQVREGASIPKTQHGTMTKGLAPAEYNIGIDPLVGPWESLSDLEAYMISSGRKDKQGNPLFINGQETTVVGSDGIPHKYIRSNGAWLAMNYSGGAATYTSDVYDTTLDKNQAEVNSDLTEAIGDVNDSISSIQDDISPLTGSFSLQLLAEYDRLEVYKGGRGKHNEVYIDDQNLAMNFGHNNTISNTRKLAFGFGQQLDVPDSTFVIGQRNSYEPNAAFIVGNGTLDGSTNNAFVIGRDGKFWVYGINGYTGQLTGASQYNSVNHFITGLDTRLTALENSSSSGGGSAQMPTAQDQLDFINTYYKVVQPVTVSYEWVSITNGPSRVYIKTDVPVKYSEAPFKIKIYGESNGDIDTSTTVDLYTGEHSRTFSSYGTLDQDIQGFDVNVATDTFPLPLDQSNYSTPNVAITFVELDSENDDYECVDGLQDPSNNTPLISMGKIVDNLTD